jgi:hypothetical protein
VIRLSGWRAHIHGLRGCFGQPGVPTVSVEPVQEEMFAFVRLDVGRKRDVTLIEMNQTMPRRTTRRSCDQPSQAV